MWLVCVCVLVLDIMVLVDCACVKDLVGVVWMLEICSYVGTECKYKYVLAICVLWSFFTSQHELQWLYFDI